MTPSRRRDRVGGVLALLVCLVLVGLITATEPDPADGHRYREVRADVGEWSRLREFDVRVTGVRATRAIRVSEQTHESADAYLVLTVEAAARTRSQYFQTVELLTRDDHRYDPRPDWTSTQPQIVAPGFSTRGVWVFELPPERVAGAVLLVASTAGEVTRYDAAALIDLGLGGSSPTSGPDGSDPVALDPATTWVTR